MYEAPDFQRVPPTRTVLSARRGPEEKDYFYALIAESLEYIEIPFEPNESWVRLIPGLEIKVVKAQSTESNYKFGIKTHKDERAFRGRLYPGSDLPNRFIAERQWVGKDGKLKRFPYPSLPFPAGGGGGGGNRAIGRIEKIRYVIAVNASHHKIPFELKDIPYLNPLLLPLPRNQI
jgi:hypothetical protein